MVKRPILSNVFMKLNNRIIMNKSIYVSPAIKEIKVRAISMIANSPTIKGIGGNAGITLAEEPVIGQDADSRRNRFWEDEEEEEDW